VDDDEPRLEARHLAMRGDVGRDPIEALVGRGDAGRLERAPNVFHGADVGDDLDPPGGAGARGCENAGRAGERGGGLHALR
jgi:hypothetical protein